ncbi:GT2 family glycosyltransferase [Jatrophihabitans sp. GAS493]|uniref:glycosyltransferase family 2 protein n=1 Tax=Jatrophihabitans sp. GAS493 TaxID=1907575 RepID=UPI000BB8C745|nr:glycosyltransferase family 2 protein [Jatrophihabitans sp. GAS493]SOD71572.1 GT2 family glycosyltransferase [Jatrophihabitans sp. GAS493]
MAGPSVLVAVCTYQRAQQLEDLLDSLIPAIAGHQARVLVIDNDSKPSSEDLVAAHAIRADYVHEPNPGIAQARNAAMSRMNEAEFIAFLDDDETVSPDWLARLLDCVEQFGTDVATGPVISLFPDGAPSWIVDGGFIQRSRMPSGTRLELAATNNVLMNVATLNRTGVTRFDVDFSRSGGSDSEFFWRLRRKGGTIGWADDAVVSEEVPLERLTFRWVFKRGVRGGNVFGRLMRREHGRIYVFLHGAALAGFGALRVLLAVVTGKGRRSKDFQWLTHGLGVAQAALGSVVYEYDRG